MFLFSALHNSSLPITDLLIDVFNFSSNYDSSTHCLLCNSHTIFWLIILHYLCRTNIIPHAWRHHLLEHDMWNKVATQKWDKKSLIKNLRLHPPKVKTLPATDLMKIGFSRMMWPFE